MNGNAREHGRQRFTLVHEIGHYVLESKASAAACSVTTLHADYLCSGYTGDEHQQAALDCGAQQFLSKPFDADQLVALIERCRDLIPGNDLK